MHDKSRIKSSVLSWLNLKGNTSKKEFVIYREKDVVGKKSTMITLQKPLHMIPLKMLQTCLWQTGARHKGRNGYCTHVGNELFAWFESTDSKKVESTF